MTSSERFFHRWRGETRVSSGRARSAVTELRETMEETSLRLSSALVIAFDARDPEMEIVAHSSRVARLAEEIAQRVGLSEGEREVVARAAQLHEIGMISVPLELLQRPSPLSANELARVRFQATVGAEIVRSTYDARTALLVARQYDDYAALAAAGEVEAADLLLAGILRVADVIDAVTSPRPYQDPMPRSRQVEVLRTGLGSKFHPLVVHSGVQLLTN